MQDTTEIEVVTTVAKSLPEQALAIREIQNADQYIRATEFLKQVKACRKRIADVFGPIVKAAHEAHKRAKAGQNDAEAPLDQAEQHVKRLVVAYDEAQEQKRIEAQREAERLAREQAEAFLLNDAAELMAAGHHDQAMAMLDQPVAVPVVIAEKQVPQVQGISYRESWQFEIVDLHAIPRQFMVPDEKAIGAVVRALKGNANIPGVRTYATKIASVRAD